MNTLTGYRHEAFPYVGDEEFVVMAARVLGDGLACGEPGVLVSTADRLTGVHDALGSAGDGVRFVDTSTEARHPALVLSVLQSFVRDAKGTRVRGLGDVTRPDRTPAMLAEAQLHDLLLNTPVCDDWNMWLGCPYDSASLTDDVVDSMLASHPARHIDMTNALAEKFGAELPLRPADADRFAVDARDLAAVRAVVRTAATMAGLDAERSDGFVYAVNEVVTNSIRHGEGAAELALWSADGSLVCEVHDGGRMGDVLAGRLAPSLGRTSGRGLWMVNHLCDLVQVRSPESGTSVRMYIGP
ncbi:MAG: sensor histidine kinase [Jatrophihabitantaceae bacterium]